MSSLEAKSLSLHGSACAIKADLLFLVQTIVAALMFPLSSSYASPGARA